MGTVPNGSDCRCDDAMYCGGTFRPFRNIPTENARAPDYLRHPTNSNVRSVPCQCRFPPTPHADSNAPINQVHATNQLQCVGVPIETLDEAQEYEYDSRTKNEKKSVDR
ncbi:predicted protein [Phaeodactylum tricornutum CCAP 1055/1]|uniref:Uncharacterized protein n=2 Tax=Phaeodactylum tricornutum TaxID=2850 RepID=B7G4Q2_PHATC|nr:predicted protein [Phaeodactylum tricornutum CCAP 1055/1]EEC46492.1 predicted protein [Phaeodactylum tricornutum CCAP 1055/1]|eukprot:XP_002181952.1 predicted protein [Phaeodactylum tricornutum CCAP 1055/1]